MKIFVYLVKLNVPCIPKGEILYRLAIIFGKTYYLDQAIEHLNLALKESAGDLPSVAHTDIFLKLSICHTEKADFRNASRCCELALSQTPDSHRTLQHMAWCQFLTGNHSTALANINKAILIEANSSEGHYIRGRVLLAAERYEEASEAFERAMLCDRGNVVYVVSLGIGKAMREKHKEAQEVLARAVKINRSLPEVWFNLGLVYEAMQRYSDALAVYEEATKIDPSFYPAVVSKHALCSNYVIPYSNSRFVHPKFHIPDPILPDKNLAKNTKLREICEDYFKTLANPQIPALGSAVEAEPVEEHSGSKKQRSNKANESSVSELDVEEEVQANKKLPPKPNGQENLGNAKPGQSDSNIHLQLQPSANSKPFSSSRVPASLTEPVPPYPTQAQIKICIPPQQSSAPVSGVSVSGSQTETAQFLNRLLQSQQRQVHGMMNAYGLLSQPGNSQPQKSGEQPLMVRYANPAELPIQFIPAFTQNNITMHQPNVSLIGNFGSVPQLGAAAEKNPNSPRELRHQAKKGVSKQSREHVLDKRKVSEEEEKESVVSPRPKVKAENSQDIEKNSSDMIVRLNMLLQKPSRKQRKVPEPSAEKEHKASYKKPKNI